MGEGESGPGERTGRKGAQSLLMPRNSPYLSAPPCSPKSSDPWAWGCWSSSLGGGRASCRVAPSIWVLQEGPRTLSVPLSRTEEGTVVGAGMGPGP